MIDELIRCARFFRQITLCRSGFSHLTNFFRHCVSAGEPLNEEVIEAWHDKTGLWIREGYGQTETTLIAATTKEMIIKPGSMGKAAPGTLVSCHLDRASNVEIGVECQIFVIVIFLTAAKFYNLEHT